MPRLFDVFGLTSQKCPAIEVSGGWADTSLVPSILFLLGSVMTAVFEMLQGPRELFKSYF